MVNKIVLGFILLFLKGFICIEFYKIFNLIWLSNEICYFICLKLVLYDFILYFKFFNGDVNSNNL